MSNGSFQQIGTPLPRRGALLFVLVSLLFLPRFAQANSTVFINSGYSASNGTGAAACSGGWCGSAQFFGLLAGPGDALSITAPGNTSYLNDIGISAGATITTSVSSGKTLNIGSSTIASVVDFSDAITNSAVPCTNSGCNANTGSSFGGSGTTKIWGGTKNDGVGSIPDVTNSYSQFTNMYDYWTSNHGSTISEPSGTFNLTSGSQNVFFINGNWTSNAVTFSCSGTCSSSTTAIFVVNGTFTQNANISVGTSGLLDDQILFVVMSSSNTALTLGSTTSITIHGDFFVNGGYTIGTSSKNVTLDGRVFAGLASGSQNLVWNGSSSLANEEDAPEPGTWFLMIGGLGCCIWLKQRRKGKEA